MGSGFGTGGANAADGCASRRGSLAKPAFSAAGLSEAHLSAAQEIAKPCGGTGSGVRASHSETRMRPPQTLA